jgi:hypothetical protein
LCRFHILLSVLFFFQMMDVVPKSDRRPGQLFSRPSALRLAVFSARILPPAGSIPEPAGSEHSQKMPARKNQHVAIDPTQAPHNFIRARADFARRFSSGAPVAEQLPVAMPCMNLHRSKPLIIAVPDSIPV